MFRIRRFAVVRTANTVAVMYFVALLIVVIPVALILVATTPQEGPAGVASAFMAPVLALIIPVFYGLASWVFTALACLLYNLTARFTGGIAVEVFGEVPPTPATSAAQPAGPQPAPYG